MAILVLILQGCSTTAVPIAPIPSTQTQPSEYRIRPGDQMDIKFYYTPELNESVIVRPDGRISLRLVNDIPAAGLTPAELGRSLAEQYASELMNPEIAVIMRTFENQRVYVDGEVNKPGLLTLSSQMTILQSITIAGGLKDTARTHEVLVIRRGLDNRPVTYRVDLGPTLAGGDATQDAILMPFDIVYVPKTSIANVNQWIDQYLRKNLPFGVGLGYAFNN